MKMLTSSNCTKRTGSRARQWAWLVLPSILGVAVASCGGTPVGDVTEARLQLVEDETVGGTLTPFGDLDPECVHEIPSGGVLDADGTVRLNGAVHARHDVLRRCAPRGQGMRPDGAKVARPNEFLPATSWVEAAQADPVATVGGLRYFNGMSAEWIVPSYPANIQRQVVFLFPSIVAYWSGGSDILQPVIKWQGHDGNSGWTMAAWYVWTDTNGSSTGYHSTEVSIMPGHRMRGTIEAVAGSGGTAQRWLVSVHNLTNGTSTSATFTSRAGAVFSKAFVALERYQVSTCDQYPSSRTVTFKNVVLQQAGPTWSDRTTLPQFFAGGMYEGLPICGFGVSIFAPSYPAPGTGPDVRLDW